MKFYYEIIDNEIYPTTDETALERLAFEDMFEAMSHLRSNVSFEAWNVINSYEISTWSQKYSGHNTNEDIVDLALHAVNERQIYSFINMFRHYYYFMFAGKMDSIPLQATFAVNSLLRALDLRSLFEETDSGEHPLAKPITRDDNDTPNDYDYNEHMKDEIDRISEIVRFTVLLPSLKREYPF